MPCADKSGGKMGAKIAARQGAEWEQVPGVVVMVIATASMLSADWACRYGYGEGYGLSMWQVNIGG